MSKESLWRDRVNWEETREKADRECRRCLEVGLVYTVKTFQYARDEADKELKRIDRELRRIERKENIARFFGFK